MSQTQVEIIPQFLATAFFFFNYISTDYVNHSIPFHSPNLYCKLTLLSSKRNLYG